MNAYRQSVDGNTKDVPIPLTDEALVDAVKSGQPSAFHELWSRHSRKTLNVIYRITRNWQDAEDALQDTFLSAFIHINSFDGRAAFSSWLHRIAINTALMILRKRRPHLEISIDGEILTDHSQHRGIADLRMDTGRLYEDWERQQYLTKALCRLHANQRSAIELRYVQGQSIRDIALSTNTSVAAAKSRLLRARATLRKSVHRDH